MKVITTMNIFPHSTDDTTACESVMDLQTGFDVLIDRLEVLAKSICQSNDDVELMRDMQPVLWLVLRLKNDLRDVCNKVGALPRPVELAQAAE